MCWHIYTEASLRKIGGDNYCSLGGAVCAPFWPQRGKGVKSSKFKCPWFAREGRDVEVRVDRRIIEYYSPGRSGAISQRRKINYWKTSGVGHQLH